MKFFKSILMSLILLGLCYPVFADDFKIYEEVVFEDETVAASATSYGRLTNGIDVRKMRPFGFFSLYIDTDTTGAAGVVTFSVQVSEDRSNWYTPSGTDDIVTGFSKASGPGADGIDSYFIWLWGSIPNYIRIKTVETGTAVGITFDRVVLKIQ